MKVTMMSVALVKILGDLKRVGGLKGTDLANIVDASAATVSRWSHDKGSPPLPIQAMIADLRYVVERLSDFYTPDEARLWLHARHPLLDGARAIDLIRDGKVEPVLAVIERLDAGAYL